MIERLLSGVLAPEFREPAVCFADLTIQRIQRNTHLHNTAEICNSPASHAMAGAC